MRLFFAVELSAEARAAAAAAIESLRPAGSRNVRWVDPAHAHITLAFLGERAPEQVPALLEAAVHALQGCATPRLRLGPAGAFPDVRQPQVIWLGVLDDHQSLGRAHASLAAGLEPLGIPRERRVYRPHLTLGRVRREAPPAALSALATGLRRLPPPPPVVWFPDAVVLFESVIGPGGATYTEIGRIAVGPP